MTDTIAASVTSAGIVPVLVIDDEAHGPQLLAALSEGGIRCVEITLRTEAGLGLIETAARDFPEMLVGAGTVLSVDDVDRVADAGARFAVSPGFDEAVVAHSLARGLLPMPGVATATEVQRARAAELSHLKFFPAESLGGVATISALSGPFADMRFMPSGGLTAANAAAYLAHSSVFAISGAWMATRAMVADGDWATITRLSRSAVDLVASR